MTSAEALEKVRKLLALGNNTPFQAEAETALGLAQKILLEHGLELAQIETDADRKSGFDGVSVFQGSRAPPEALYVGQIVEDFFFCLPVTERIVTPRQHLESRLVLIGRQEHLPMARHVWVYLSRVYRALWPPYRAAHRLPRSDRAGFWTGMTLGLSLKLAAERDAFLQQCKASAGAIALMHGAAEAAAEAWFGGLEKRRAPRPVCSSEDAINAGFVRGQAIDLRKPLPQPRAQPALPAPAP